MSIWGNLAVRDKVQNTLILAGVETVSGPTKLSLVLSYIKLSYSEFKADRDTQSILGAISHDSKIIFVNEDLPEKDKHITLAHEIGHAILHPKENMVDFRAKTQAHLDDDQKEKEREANVFACELVMPYPYFVTIYESYFGDIGKISDHFLVPEKYITKRIKFLKKQVKEEYIPSFQEY